jgi:hypothetical protein
LGFFCKILNWEDKRWRVYIGHLLRCYFFCKRLNWEEKWLWTQPTKQTINWKDKRWKVYRSFVKILNWEDKIGHLLRCYFCEILNWEEKMWRVLRSFLKIFNCEDMSWRFRVYIFGYDDLIDHWIYYKVFIFFFFFNVKC